MGLTNEEAEKLNKVVEEVFKNGVVGSVEEATQAVSLVKSAFGDLNDADLEKLTNNITTIAKRTGTDVQENVNAAEKMMNSFGVTGTEATDLIAAGFQNNLNKSGDFLDTLNEYSPHFEAAGYKADEMLQIISNGMENGSMNTDKAADAVKELQVKLGDGSLEKAFGSYSKETQNMFDKWKDGKATTAEVAESISKDLKKLSPNEQQAALSALSSQFEDLGVDGAAALFNVGDAFTDVTGKADDMAKKSPGEKWESSMCELQTALLPIGQNLTDALTPIVEGLAEMGKWFGDLPGPIQTFIAIFGGIIAVVAALLPVVIALIIGIGALNFALLPVIAIVLGIAAAIALIIIIIKNWGAITDWIGDKWTQFIDWLSEAVPEFAAKFVVWMNDMKEGAVNKFNDLKNGAIDKVKGLQTGAENLINAFKKNAVNKAGELKTSFVNKVNELKDGAVGKFTALRDKAGEIMKQAKNKILSPIEEARDKISGIVDKIKGFFSGLKLKIPTPSMPKMPKFSLKTSSKTVFGKEISYPSGIDVKWNAKGGIFTEPTIFGMNNGRLQGIGEAGPEAALPLNAETLGAIGKGISDTMKGSGDERNINVIVYLDTDEVNTKLAPGMSKKINSNNKLGGRKIGVVIPG